VSPAWWRASSKITLTGQAEAPDQGLIDHLLKRKRNLLIVDGLSELNEATRNKIRPLSPSSSQMYWL